ncbi:MAG: polyribitolphosphotransferase [Globicatella sulfidifaciens]|uniref:Polyribitolphosphotransferase n=2 Tax=Globicatella sulfidifaciens TaxID=136093 RepID=A0A7X8H0Z7_9LACT|nr:polyribitolphosphotransferase [Globicatella sulfidifaciens]
MLKLIKRGARKMIYRNKKSSKKISDKQVILHGGLSNGANFDRSYDYEPSEFYIPKRKVTHMEWYGAKLYLKGYYYLQGIELDEEDLVKKELVLFSKNKEKYRITLRDIPITQVTNDTTLIDRYYWAGFEGEINFSNLTNGKMPIENGNYIVYIELETFQVGKGPIKRLFPIGNIEEFINNGFHSAKMEYFTAKRELKYNLIASYDYAKKTLVINSIKLKDIDPREFGLQEKESNGLWYRLVKKKIFKLAYILFCLLPINQKKVLFASDSRDDMSGNFQFVYDEMVSQNLEFKYRFILKRSVDHKKTTFEIFKLAYEIATSKYILLDDFFPMIYNLRIRKNAELVQLWHAVGAFKTFGFSRIGLPGGPSPRSKNHRNYTKVTVSSSNIIKHYAEGFGIEEEKVLATGVPRTDIFFDDEYKEKITNELYSQYPFLKGKKVITFAPTFRGNGQQSAYYDLEALHLDKLYENLKDEYVFLFKLHPFVKNSLDIPYLYQDFFYDFSEYREINDLLFITDILITDYSSVCFEFALLNRPMIFFSYDVAEYVKTRDFYYDYLSFIPGPLAKTTEEMINIIKTEDFKMEKIPPFIDYFFDQTDGKSSERVVNEIFKG